MRYHSRTKLQLTTALTGALAVMALGYFIYGEIDWPTVIGVTLGLFLGIGFSKQAARGIHAESTDKKQNLENDTENDTEHRS